MERIPVAGPSITQKEIDYVTDAVSNCWYGDANRYHDRFERAFAEYLDVRFAAALPSCTSAIHLALAALGIGPGDEVVVPDITWIASAAPISYVGATPVLADVDPQSWCLSAESLEALITPRTKAVIPVDLYGSLPDMDAIREIAARRGLSIVEDAAEAIGSQYQGRQAGSLGDVGVFSFHGSKTMTTGEGGMLVTNRRDLYERVLYLRDHGRHPGDKMFWNSEVAFKYKMSSMQAALGLAQLERIDELIERKRQIFAWYQRALQGCPHVTLNREPAGIKNTYWMVTAIVDPQLALPKERLIGQMAAEGIDCRPFFYPLSSLPAYVTTPQGRRAQQQNHVSYALSPFGINLPCGMRVTEQVVARVAAALTRMVAEQARKNTRRARPPEKLSKSNFKNPNLRARVPLMGSMPLVSIGMPVYNGLPHVQEAAAALLAQDYPNFELVVSDNASTDGTGEYFRQLAAKDSRVRYCRNSVNVGAMNNFSAVLQRARGKYFMWAAHDDRWNSTFVSALAEALDAARDAVLATPVVVHMNEDGTLRNDPVDRTASGTSGMANLKILCADHAIGWYYGLYRTDWIRRHCDEPSVYPAWGNDCLWLADVCLRYKVVGNERAMMWKRLRRSGVRPKKRPGNGGQLGRHVLSLHPDQFPPRQKSARAIDGLGIVLWLCVPAGHQAVAPAANGVARRANALLGRIDEHSGRLAPADSQAPHHRGPAGPGSRGRRSRRRPGRNLESGLAARQAGLISRGEPARQTPSPFAGAQPQVRLRSFRSR